MPFLCFVNLPENCNQVQSKGEKEKRKKDERWGKKKIINNDIIDDEEIRNKTPSRWEMATSIHEWTIRAMELNKTFLHWWCPSASKVLSASLLMEK